MTRFPLSPLQVRLLLATAALSSAVGLVLELMLVTQASYLVGDAALATGVVVGTFLAAMGLGAWVSQFVGTNSNGSDDPPRLLRVFLLVELALSPLCLLAPLVLVTPMVGVLGGMKLPLITRLLQGQQALRTALARALALDYAGALVGSLLFPLLLLPWLGLLPTAGLLALVPLLSSMALCWAFPSCRSWRWAVSALLPLGSAAALAIAPLGNRIENDLYDDPVVSRLQTRHQRIVLTRRRDDLRLYLDGQLQFSSLDEYRYHEALVHPAMAFHPTPRRVLLLGAGDGLALRELLRWPQLRRIDLVELDPQMLRLARRHPFLRRLNGDSLADPRVVVHTGDAFDLVRRLSGGYDVVIADFPDPSTAALARLYSLAFYGRLLGHLAPGGVIVTQASTPFFTPKVLASIEATFQALSLKTKPYSVDVPSFGPWGFVLAHRPGQELVAQPLPFQGRWFGPDQLDGLFQLAPDLRPPPGQPVLPNRLMRPVLVEYQRQSRWKGP